MEEVAITANLASEAIDFSLFSLFLRADMIVKSVILILIFSSIYSWTIIVGKLVKIKRLRQLDKEFDEIFWSGNSFEDLYETLNYNQNDPKSKLFCSAIEEWKKSNKNSESLNNPEVLSSLKERMLRSMQISFNKETEIYGIGHYACYIWLLVLVITFQSTNFYIIKYVQFQALCNFHNHLVFLLYDMHFAAHMHNVINLPFLESILIW